jgi:predicted RNase H-like HicB family nuclease
MTDDTDEPTIAQLRETVNDAIARLKDTLERTK